MVKNWVANIHNRDMNPWIINYDLFTSSPSPPAIVLEPEEFRLDMHEFFSCVSDCMELIFLLGKNEGQKQIGATFIGSK